EPEAQPHRIGEVDARHAPRIGRAVENAVGGKGEGLFGKALPAPAADLVARASPRRRIYRVELHGHEAERRARQARLERATNLRSSPRGAPRDARVAGTPLRGPRGRGSGLGVPGLASLARDTKSWIPAFAGMNGGCITRGVDEKDIVALRDAWRREYNLTEHAQRHRRPRGEPRRDARRHRPRDDKHARDHAQRVTEEGVHGAPRGA